MQKLDSARYESVSDFLASLSELRSTRNEAYALDFDTNRRASWYGANCATAPDVIRTIDAGWPEGQASVQALLDKVSAAEATPVDRRRRLSRSDTGDALDMGAVYRGRLDIAWTRATRRASYGPQKIDLLANMICSGVADSSVLQWRGAAAIALADKLEAAGYMVRIVVGFGGETEVGHQTVSCRICVKDYDKPLDIATAAAVTLPGFFRALGHCWTVRHAASFARNGSMSVRQCQIEQDEIVLSHNVRDERTALAFVDAEIEKLNAAAAA